MDSCRTGKSIGPLGTFGCRKFFEFPEKFPQERKIVII
jgi:hypothetical protein